MALSCVGDGGEGSQEQQLEAKGTKGAGSQKAGSHREESVGEGESSPWAGELRAGGRVCQSYPAKGRD